MTVTNPPHPVECPICHRWVRPRRDGSPGSHRPTMAAPETAYLPDGRCRGGVVTP